MATSKIKCLQSRLKVASSRLRDIEVAANSGPHYADITIGEDGYIPLGIVGWRFGNASTDAANSSMPKAYQAYIVNSTTARIAYRYDHTSDGKFDVLVDVLYQKNN